MNMPSREWASANTGSAPTAAPPGHAAVAAHRGLAPSAWVQRWTHLLTPGTRVLDLACGSGRHSHWLASHGMAVWSVDRDEEALARVRADWPTPATHPPHTLCLDLESGTWPLGADTFAAIVVTNYLWRPLWPHLLAAVAAGGVLLYETFAHGNASVGKPSRPDFLLQAGELLQVCQGMHIVAYEDGFCAQPDRFVQRIVAVRPPLVPLDEATPPRFALASAQPPAQPVPSASAPV